MSSTSEDPSGAISPSGRFARMEDLLEKILGKLDRKADETRVTELEARHTTLEHLLNDLLSGRLMTPPSAQTQESVRTNIHRLETIESEIDDLQKKDSNRVAVAEAIKSTADNRYRQLLWLVGITTVASLVISAIGWLATAGVI